MSRNSQGALNPMSNNFIVESKGVGGAPKNQVLCMLLVLCKIGVVCFQETLVYVAKAMEARTSLLLDWNFFLGM